MKKLQKGLRILLFTLLIILSLSGLGLPALFFARDRNMFFKERIDEKKDKKKEDVYHPESGSK